MAPRVLVAALTATLALAGDSGASLAAAPAEERQLAAALPADDECTPAGGPDAQHCALNALQLRGLTKETRPTEAPRPAAMEETSETRRSKAAEALAREHTVLEAWQAQAQAREAELRHSNYPSKPMDPCTWRPGEKMSLNETGCWHGGGLVDGLPGQDQVEAMAMREQDWKIGRIVYQVFVDRFVPPADFERQKRLHQPPQTVHNWTDPVTGGGQDPETKYYAPELAFYGGDLQGVKSKLDYIQELADILYLQPIFEAFSVHKYDTSDYHKIDPSYGTLEDFYDLTNDVHKRGMKLVLDGVFNHIGVRSKVFKEAMASSEARTRPWFFIGPEYGKLGYKAWQGGGTLAELRLEDATLQDAIWGKNDSVIAMWLHRGADGWRLDVGTEIGREFLWQLTKAAHTHKYGSLIVGEVSAYPRWWTESMDGILSFWMGWVIAGVVTQKMGGVFAGMQISTLIQESSMEQVLRSWIVVSNHDLPRLSAKYPDPKLRKFAMTLQFVLPGAVCLYYGEELGMEGSGDPYNRAPMRWDMVSDNNDILNHTRHLVAMRRRHRALRIGDFHTLMSFSLLAFTRRTDKIDDIMIVLANPTSSPVEELVAVPVEDILEYTLFRDVLTGHEVRIRGGTCQMKVPPHTARVLAMVDETGPSADQYKRIYGHWDTFPGVSPMTSLGNSVGDIV